MEPTLLAWRKVDPFNFDSVDVFAARDYGGQKILAHDLLPRRRPKSLCHEANSDQFRIVFTSEETNGAISIIEQLFEPGLLLPPHVHENDVWLHVLEGEMHVRVAEEVVKATPGCWVLKPRRIPHTTCGTGSEQARIELYTPGGFELFFKDFGERLRQGPIGLDELNSLGKPHGIRFFNDWVPDLKAAYNLRVIGE